MFTENPVLNVGHSEHNYILHITTQCINHMDVIDNSTSIMSLEFYKTMSTEHKHVLSLLTKSNKKDQW